MGDSFTKQAFVIFLACVLSLMVIQSRGAEIISPDWGPAAHHDSATADALVGYHGVPKMSEGQSYVLGETKTTSHESPFISSHFYRGPPGMPSTCHTGRV